MRRLTLLCCLALLPAAPALAQDVNSMPMKEMNMSGGFIVSIGKRPDLSVTHAWIAATTAPGDARGYVTIDNNGAADRLSGATCSLAQGTAIKSSKPAKHAMEGMQPMDNYSKPILLWIDIPAHGQAILKPNGNFILLQDVAQKLMPGQRIGCRLDFVLAGPKDISMVVAKTDLQASP